MPFPEKRQVTAKRLAANRAAARKSTGPRTAPGKQRSAFNSFQHGGFAREDHILRQALERSGDDPDALDRRRQELASDWKPATAQQKLLIDDLAWLYWLRDRARRVFLESQGRRVPRAQLDRDRRHFEARHRAPAVSVSDYDPDGCATLPASLDKFRTMREFLDDLQDYATRARWSQCDEGRAYPEGLLNFLYGKPPSTARGRQVRKLWKQCELAKAKADDPRAAQILALLAEERAALDEEEALFEREQQMELGEPENPIDPLSETWQEMMRQLERLDRQINAKVRLLLRLEQRASAAAQAAPPSQTTEPAETMPSPVSAETGEMASKPPACPATASPRREGEESFRSNPNQALESIAKPNPQAASCSPPATAWRSFLPLRPPEGDEHLASGILLGYSSR